MVTRSHGQGHVRVIHLKLYSQIYQNPDVPFFYFALAVTFFNFSDTSYMHTCSARSEDAYNRVCSSIRPTVLFEGYFQGCLSSLC